MTENTSLHLPHFAAVTAAGVFLAAWVATHFLHDRRLKRFANPHLLGLAGMWPRRICTGVLLAGTAGALTALLGVVGDRQLPPGNGPRPVAFLIDPPERSQGIGYMQGTWENYSRDLRHVVECIRPEQAAFFVTGSAARLVVPRTGDMAGAFLLLEARSADYEASTASAFEASVGAVRLISSGASAETASAIVVLSPKAESEIDAVANSLRSGPPVVFVRSTAGRERPGYRREGPGAQWMRLDEQESFSAFAGTLGHANERRGWQIVQVLALAAFLLLYLEWSCRLTWPAGSVTGRRVEPESDLNDTAGGGRSGRGFFRCLLGVSVCLAAPHVSASQSGHAGEISHRISVESIGPNVAIVTEMSDEDPYVGQQFSVIYSLRCTVPPVAVDVDPQDFAGFWTVTTPTTGQARPEPVTLNGRPATDFLLRQLIVFPLKPGRQVLPSLRLKIKQDVNSRDDWDLTRQAGPVMVNVKPVPVAGDRQDVFFMVGSLDAAVSGGDSGGSHEAVLEIEGTANLDLFRPEQWLNSRDGQPVLVRLKAAERLVQTRDYEGKRRLTLLQRQRWAVVTPAGERGDIALKPLSIPVFDPEASTWRSVDLPAFGLGSGASQAAQALHPPAGARQGQDSIRARFLNPGSIAFTVSCLALLVVVITGRRKRSARTG